MKEELIKLLGLTAEGSETDIVKAVSELRACVELPKPSSRELDIRTMMDVTGCTRHDAEHTVDRRAQEEDGRKRTRRIEGAK